MATIDDLNAAILSLEGAVAQKNLEIDNLRLQLAAAQAQLDASTLDTDLSQAVARITSAKNMVANF